MAGQRNTNNQTVSYCGCGNYLSGAVEEDRGTCWACHLEAVERRQARDEAGAESASEAGRRELVRSLRTLWE